ncbi:MAG: membrane-bound lytic murein transglycosylase MltF [Gammaproteobacteria bacterium]
MAARRPLIVAFLAVVALLAAVAATTGVFDVPSRLETVQQRGALVMLTRNGATTYFTDAGGETGPEYELAREFATFLGVDIEVRVAPSFAALEEMLEAGEGDLIAANMTRTTGRAARLRFGPPYDETHTLVVHRRGLQRPAGPEDLVGLRGRVLAGSSYEDVLQRLSVDHPELTWESAGDAGIEDLLLAIDDGEIDYTLVDERIFALSGPFYPEVARGFTVGESQQLAWAFLRDDDDSLVQQAALFMAFAREEGTLAAVHERFFSPPPQLDQVGMMRFVERVRERLPPWLPLFQEVADHHGVDWRLLAAVGYQESHWDHDAVSPTGVRGLMMLTRDTASELGLDDRRDPLQSIRGGARYYLNMKARLPERIPEPDRSWMALAAYNIGLGHLEDARVLAQRQGGDPDSWEDVSRALPLLAQARYYGETRHGYARGREAQRYVRNVQRFYDTLVWMDTRDHPLLASRVMAAP